MGTRWVIGFMQALARLPLPCLRVIGAGLGHVLYAILGGRRRVVLTNLALCFPQWTQARRRQVAREVFVHFAQAWLDRGWLWAAPLSTVRGRVRLVGAVEALRQPGPVVVFAPHFMGLDAGWAALCLELDREMTTIYTDQANKQMDAWILAGRQRFGRGRLFGRVDGVRDIVASLRAGDPLYLLPDMNFGPEESVFVPFFGVAAATVPSLSRFARLARARVVPVVTRLRPDGYEVQVLPAWDDFPTADALADTAVMNARLERWVEQCPGEYYWVHKRFKSRPAGERPVY